MSLTIDYSRTERALAEMGAAAAGTKYSLTLINESAHEWAFFVYQTPPAPVENVFSLAWFASPYKIAKETEITFEWEINYDFVWNQTGILVPGVVFHANSTKHADLDKHNKTHFSAEPSPQLSSPEAGTPAGSLLIEDSVDVPNDTFSVGIGMSGTGTFAVQAGPELTHKFTPTPTYWIGAGVDQKIGTVLDVQTLTRTREVKFKANVYALTYVLNEQNAWVEHP